MLDASLADARRAASLDPTLVKAHFRRAQLCVALMAAAGEENQEEGQQKPADAEIEARRQEAVASLYDAITLSPEKEVGSLLRELDPSLDKALQKLANLEQGTANLQGHLAGMFDHRHPRSRASGV